MKKPKNLFPHIKEASNAARGHLQESRKTCVIMPTGTGKTTVSLLVTEALGVKTLYLCPNNNILEQTREKYRNSGVKNVEFMTYPKMMRLVKKDDLSAFSGVGLFILDELHRLGSKVWGEKSWGTIDNKFPDSKVLGLTATEIRYLDGGRDMARELFDRDIAYELTLAECFERGILRVPRYVIGGDLRMGLKDLEKKVETLKNPDHKKKVREMIKTLQHNWAQTKGVSGIFKKYIIDNMEVNLHKMIVFHERISETEEVKKTIEDTLRGAGYTGPIKFYIANSGKGQTYSKREIKAFNSQTSEYGINILLTVNMCNEGIHIDDCEIAVMYRKTMSKTIYLQQLGRVLSLDRVNRPVILDLVQNVSLSDGNILEAMSKSPTSSSQGGSRGNVKLDLPVDYEISDVLLDFKKICESFDEDKKELLEKLDEWYDLCKTGDLNAFVI